MKSNEALMTGEFIDNATYSHTIKDNEIYVADLLVRRKSGVEDIIPVEFTKDVLGEKKLMGLKARVSGEFRSSNRTILGKRRLILRVRAFEIEVLDPENEECENSLFLDGFICKESVLRKTPKGKTICDLLIAVNRNKFASDYIPCIAWNTTAEELNQLSVGAHVQLHGRIQSRGYTKTVNDGCKEIRTAYEFSINTFKIISERGNKVE